MADYLFIYSHKWSWLVKKARRLPLPHTQQQFGCVRGYIAAICRHWQLINWWTTTLKASRSPRAHVEQLALTREWRQIFPHVSFSFLSSRGGKASSGGQPRRPRWRVFSSFLERQEWWVRRTAQLQSMMPQHIGVSAHNKIQNPLSQQLSRTLPAFRCIALLNSRLFGFNHSDKIRAVNIILQILFME